ncbi:MAG: aminotransferase class V-fold PLP-dependent enzyme [Nitriliruptorales bacterium]|nr:aminotransferase class V-fold PLP-dependent enzyme [Nitriliruptorales bacterium]
MQDDHEQALGTAADMGIAWLRSLPKRPVAPTATMDQLRSAFVSELPEHGLPATDVLRDLAAAAEPGTVAMAGPRYFGFVIGGSHPAALGADWLSSAWDQNAGLVVGGPAAAVAEELAGQWVLDLLGLPAAASFALVTGCQMAHFTALAAARHHVLSAAGWDLATEGLFGAPPLTVVVGGERHVTVDRALRFLGIGRSSILHVPADDQGRMRTDQLPLLLRDLEGPVIVCAQAGNVNTGAFDDIAAICDVAHDSHAWVHVDGAFGMWAAASPKYAHLVNGIERADSWATDAHKWLNVPFDCGIAVVAHPRSHRAAMSVHADYLEHDTHGDRDQMDWNPEFSRRARGFPLYAVLRAWGREGVAAVVERCCDHARRFAETLAVRPDVEIVNDVVLNQVLVRFGNDDERTRAVVAGVQKDGTCWLSGTTYQGRAAMRISVVNWSTTTDDVDQSAEAILRVAATIS